MRDAGLPFFKRGVWRGLAPWRCSTAPWFSLVGVALLFAFLPSCGGESVPPSTPRSGPAKQVTPSAPRPVPESTGAPRSEREPPDCPRRYTVEACHAPSLDKVPEFDVVLPRPS